MHWLICILFCAASLTAREVPFTLHRAADKCFANTFQDHLQSLSHLDTPNQKMLIMFSGTPGMGKSTIAKQLEKQYSAIRLSTDEVRDFLQKHGLSRGLSDEYMRWCLKKITENYPNKFIILDRSIDRNYDEYQAFAKEFYFDTFLIRMKLDKATLKKRIISRGFAIEDFLRDLDNFWKDHENFNAKNSTDFTFNNAKDYSKHMDKLVHAISDKIGESYYVKFQSGTRQHHKMRRQILDKSRKRVPFDAYMNEILPGIYIGNKKSIVHLPSFFSHVISLRSKQKPPTSPDVIWKPITIPDTPEANISAYFDETYEFIDNAQGKILIHCHRGGSRSVTIAIAYIMRKFNVSFEDACAFVKSKRPITEPNPGFVAQLQQYEKKLNQLDLSN